MIRFNKPYHSGKELNYISKAITEGKTSGNQTYTKKCHQFFKDTFGFQHCLLTTSCTDALEMSAILANIKHGDEIIMPSYTFVSTSNAFILRGAKIKFIDSYDNNPNLDHTKIEEAITSKTKAIVVVHYAGIACDMDAIITIGKKHNLFVIEDAAQAIDSYYKGKPLGSLGDFSAFSFHETKNIICGEGGLLIVNNEKYNLRSEIIWEKGTNRSSFFRGEIDKYGWVDMGSSFLASDILAAFLYAQLENLEDIQSKRKNIWNNYYVGFAELETQEGIQRPHVPEFAIHNGHLFYLVCRSSEERSRLIKHLKSDGIHAVFHYLSLHKSQYYSKFHDSRELANCDRFTECLVRLPLYYELNNEQQQKIINSIYSFYKTA